MMSDAERIQYQVGCMARLDERDRRAGFLRRTARRRARRRGGPAVPVGGRLPRHTVVPYKEPLELIDADEPVLVRPRQVLVRRADAPRALEVLGARTRYATPNTTSTTVELVAGVPVADAVEMLRAQDIRAGANHAAAYSGRSKGGSSPKRVDVAPSSPRTADTPVDIDDDALTVVIVDTGIDLAALGKADENRQDHWLDGITAPCTDDVDLLDTESADGADVPDGYLDLGAGHGTFVAGIIRRALPTARIVMIRALESDGYGTEAAIELAIARANREFAQRSGPGLLNLSLGIESLALDGGTDVPVGIESAIAALPDDVAVIAAAGNGRTELPVWPAAFDGVLAVASLTPDGEPSSWSNHGDWVDFSMVGEGVVSTFVAGEETRGSGDEDDPFDPYPDTFEGPDPYAIWSGTSFSTAKVTGRLAAELAARGDGDVGAAVAALRDRGQRIDGYGVALEDDGA